MSFDPNAPATEGGGLFGLPYGVDEAELVIVPVPWEATTSYGGGTAGGPAAVLEASRQVDLHDLDVDEPWRVPLALAPLSAEVEHWSQESKRQAAAVIEAWTSGEPDPARLAELVAPVNARSRQVNDWVQNECAKLYAQGKLVAVLGGDHAVPLGAFKAAAARFGAFGILHFDAHADLRDAYEGFDYSHASIMHNALEEVPELERLVQVSIRDVCKDELDYAKAQGDRVRIVSDRELAHARFRGESFASVCERIVALLPKQVWVSFDIDGLDPKLCPNTGTPVPGGMEFQEAVFLLRQVVASGRTLIGFDLCEVSPGADEDDEWDANVGARLLYKLAGLTMASHGRASLLP